jgi:NTP pyrophosphatase (non-canonical NTP hydrolase)
MLFTVVVALYRLYSRLSPHLYVLRAVEIAQEVARVLARVDEVEDGVSLESETREVASRERGEDSRGS